MKDEDRPRLWLAHRPGDREVRRVVPPLPVPEVSIVQLTSPPAPAGRGSLRVTPVAVAVPLLVIVTVKPAVCPADDGDWSAVLVTVTLGAPPVMVTGSTVAPLVTAALLLSPL